MNNFEQSMCDQIKYQLIFRIYICVCECESQVVILLLFCFLFFFALVFAVDLLYFVHCTQTLKANTLTYAETPKESFLHMGFLLSLLYFIKEMKSFIRHNKLA